MKFIYNNLFLNHNYSSHPENNKRLKSIIELGKIKETPLNKIPNGEKYLELIHNEKHIHRVKDFSKNQDLLDSDTYTSKDSYRIACYAAGAAIKAAEENAFALVRPPGHHATWDRAMGFCLFNNIAIATKYLLKKKKKVLVLDIDGHHGNGSADCFRESEDVLFISLHQYPAYPGTGWINDIGKALGEGHIINIALPPESGDDILINALETFIPVAKEFTPDYVGISAGFDAHYSDPLLNLKYSLNGFYNIGKILNKNFKNIFATLEGGYNLKYLPKSILNFVAGINGKKRKFKDKTTTSDKLVLEEYKTRLEKLKENLEEYWKFK
jgi:acetoin utilization deacetylase AcuC-like enzyme